MAVRAVVVPQSAYRGRQKDRQVGMRATNNINDHFQISNTAQSRFLLNTNVIIDLAHQSDSLSISPTKG